MGDPLEALAATIAVALNRAVGDLPLDEARALVTATVRRRQLRALDRHLTAHPDALTCGSSDAPPSLLHLAATLAERGHHQVRVPRCAGCDRLRELRHRVENGRLCDDCYHARRAATCSRCGNHRHISSRTDTGDPLCASCYPKPVEPCGRCGRPRLVRQRREDGSALCPACYRTPTRRCRGCDALAPTYSHTDDGDPVCRSCYQRPQRRCGGCGQIQRIELRASNDQPDLCTRCATRTPAPCTRCDALHPAHPKALLPVCLACRDTGHVLEPDLTETPPKPRRRADETDHDALRTRIRAVLNDPAHGVADQLAPLVNAYDHLDDVAMPLAWFRGHSPGLGVLADLAHHAHARPVDHALLDTYPQTPALHWLRALLVAAGVLPSRDELLDRVELWLDQLLADRPATHARIIEPFVTWHLLRQARLRARRRPTGRNTATHIRTQARLAVEFLAWLDDRELELSSATQGDLELWLTSGRQTRYVLAGFISWARSRGLCPNRCRQAP